MNVKILEDKERIEFFTELKKLDVNIYEITYILRESFVRMNENKDYEDYSEDEIKSIIDYLTRFSKGCESPSPNKL